MSRYLVAALYKFVALDDPAGLQAPLKQEGDRLGICGSLLLAQEGINGTIAGRESDLRTYLSFLRSFAPFAELEHKESWAQDKPFHRLRIRLKKEIVTMGAADIVSEQSVGTYVCAQDWNAVISRPDMVVIDTRNDYECDIGTFRGAIDPQIDHFTQFPEWVKQNPALHNKPPVAMFCTGGIRCEKATAFMRAQGFEEVYHLKGGILKYLEEVPEQESLWEGECFVFDQRVAVKHGLEEGSHEMCHACWRPVSPEQRADPRFEPGICCPQCADSLTQERRAALVERQRQIALAKQRGETHLGQNAGALDTARKQARKAEAASD
ncbi:MAG: rhodanese-related sulfurtransferase [Neomegalonema sp.]|nr:rhodanese-related sulfurtransferase [Neomegalonema sp.]